MVVTTIGITTTNIVELGTQMMFVIWWPSKAGKSFPPPSPCDFHFCASSLGMIATTFGATTK